MWHSRYCQMKQTCLKNLQGKPSSLENKCIAFSEPTCWICTSIVLSCMMLLSPIQSNEPEGYPSGSVVAFHLVSANKKTLFCWIWSKNMGGDTGQHPVTPFIWLTDLCKKKQVQSLIFIWYSHSKVWESSLLDLLNFALGWECTFQGRNSFWRETIMLTCSAVLIYFAVKLSLIKCHIKRIRTII